MPEPVTMLRTLQSIQKTLKTQMNTGGTLTSIKKAYLGPAHNPVGYPIVSVLPIEEKSDDIWNGVLNNTRRIRIEAFSHKAKSKASMRSSMGIIENVKDLFVSGASTWLIPDPDTEVDMMYETLMENIVPGSNPTPYRNGFISSASIELDCSSRDGLHDGVGGTSASQLIESDAKTLVDTLMSTFKKYKVGVESFLESTRSFKSFTLPPQPVYPVLFVGIEGESRFHKYTGRDQVVRSVNVYVLSKLLDKGDALEQNLKIIDMCRRIFFANKDLGGIAAHFDYRGIIFGQLTVNNQLLYGSSLNIDIECIEALPVLT